MAFRYPRGVHFQCTRCGLCCGDTKEHSRRVLLLREDAWAISRAVSKPVETFAVRVKGFEPYFYEMRKVENEGKCVYLQGSGCMVYGLRPLVCRFYPFELLTLEDGEHAFSCAAECPGIGRGRQLRKDYFGRLFQLATERLETKKGEET